MFRESQAAPYRGLLSKSGYPPFGPRSAAAPVCKTPQANAERGVMQITVNSKMAHGQVAPAQAPEDSVIVRLAAPPEAGSIQNSNRAL